MRGRSADCEARLRRNKTGVPIPARRAATLGPPLGEDSRDRVLVRSSFLSRVQAGEDVVYFHRLFGTSLVLNQAAEALLDRFRMPTTTANALAGGEPVGRRGDKDLASALASLIAKRFLASPQTDDRAEFVRQMRPAPVETGAHLQKLVLLAAERCNLACPYCIKDRLMELRPARRQALMTAETAALAVDAFVAVAEMNGLRTVGLSFRGGEALLNSDVVLGATRRLRARWLRGPVEVSLVTNATRATNEIARALAAERIAVEVSIDGPREIHDAVRYTKSGRPTYDAVLAGLDRLRSAGVTVANVNTTVTVETFPQIDAGFLANLARLGVRHVNLEPDVLRPVHRDPEIVAEWVMALQAAGRAYGIQVSGCWERAVGALGRVRRGDALPPPNDIANLVVDAHGMIVTSEYNAEEELGPVADLPKVLASEAYRRHIASRTPGDIPECRGCEVEGLCQGNASLARIYERITGRSGLFHHRCEVIRLLTRAVLREPTELHPATAGASLWAECPNPAPPRGRRRPFAGKTLPK